MKSKVVGALLPLLLSLSSASRIDERHTAPRLDKTAYIEFPQYTETAMMESQCHPEEDGYFGGTSGHPVKFQFVFEMETKPTANLQTALLMIRDRVTDEAVSHSFPQLCDSRKKRVLEETFSQGQVTGFRFSGTPVIDLNELCSPLLARNNYCGVFKGQISVFGEELQNDSIDHIIANTIDSISDLEAELASYGIVRVAPSKRMTVVITDREGWDGSMIAAEGSGMTIGSMVLLVLCIIFLVSGLGLLAFYLQMDVKNETDHQKAAASERNQEVRSFLRYFTSALSGNDTQSSDSNPYDDLYMQDDHGFDRVGHRIVYIDEQDGLMVDRSYSVDTQSFASSVDLVID